MRLQHFLVTLGLVHLEVIEELAALRDLAEETPAGGEVLLVFGQMLAQEIDLLGEDRDLHGGGTGVALVGLVLGDESFLGSALEGHGIEGRICTKEVCAAPPERITLDEGSADESAFYLSRAKKQVIGAEFWAPRIRLPPSLMPHCLRISSTST